MKKETLNEKVCYHRTIVYDRPPPIMGVFSQLAQWVEVQNGRSETPTFMKEVID